MVVWVYAGGGQAELGIVPWLERHFPDVTFERRTPQITKPGPRPNLNPTVVKKNVVGQTGKALDLKIRQNLQQHWTKDAAQAALLLDDTDCEAPEQRERSLRRAVEETLQAETPCTAVALAVPELEVWLLADWKNAFEKAYPSCQAAMRRRLTGEGVHFRRLEEFDCRCDTPDYRKISETLRFAFEVCCGNAPGYSKATDTPRLLMQIDPDQVAARCPHFKAFWNELKSCLKTPSS